MNHAQDLKFTTDNRAALLATAARLSDRLSTPVDLVLGETEVGDEWAAFCLLHDDRPGAGPLATIQTVMEPGRRFVVLHPSGQESQRRSGVAIDPVLALAESVAVNAAVAARQESGSLRSLIPSRRTVAKQRAETQRR